MTAFDQVGHQVLAVLRGGVFEAVERTRHGAGVAAIADGLELLQYSAADLRVEVKDLAGRGRLVVAPEAVQANHRQLAAVELLLPLVRAVGDALLFWEGELDQAGWQAGRESIAHFTAESLASVALRPKPSRYTNDEQQRLYPGDTSLDVDPATDAATVVWPAASYFRV